MMALMTQRYRVIALYDWQSVYTKPCIIVSSSPYMQSEDDSLCEYEQQRLRNIKENRAMLASLNIFYTKNWLPYCSLCIVRVHTCVIIRNALGIPTGHASTTHFFHFLKLKYQARVNLFEKDIKSLHLHMRTCFTSMGLTRVSISIVHLGQCTFRPICFQLLSKAWYLKCAY